MTDHLVQTSVSPNAIHLDCMDCDWFAQIGRRHLLDYDTYIAITPVAEMVKWSHIDPTILAARPEEVTERSTWRRVREYLTRGVAP